MLSYVSVIRCTLCIAMAVSAFALLYVYIASNGEVWVNRSVLVVKQASLILSFAALALGGIDKSKGLLIGGAFALLVWYLAPVPGQIGCMFDGLSGGYSRNTNCGLDASLFPAFTTYLAVLLFHRRATKILLFVSCLIAPVGFAVAYMYLANPLVREVSSIDPNTECIARQSNQHAYSFDVSSLNRIQNVGELNIGWIIGEQSPRVFKVQGNNTYVWKFSQRSFVRVKTNEKLVSFCNRE